MSDIECPYCGHEQEVCQDDGHACVDGEIYEEECRSCEMMFALVPAISYSFRALKSACMNGEPHQWEVSQQSTFNGATHHRCKECGDLKWMVIQEAGE